MYKKMFYKGEFIERKELRNITLFSILFQKV